MTKPDAKTDALLDDLLKDCDSRNALKPGTDRYTSRRPSGDVPRLTG